MNSGFSLMSRPAASPSRTKLGSEAVLVLTRQPRENVNTAFVAERQTLYQVDLQPVYTGRRCETRGVLCWHSVHMRCTGALLHQQELLAAHLKSSLALPGWGRFLPPPAVGCRHSVSTPMLRDWTPALLLSRTANDDAPQASPRIV